MIVSGDRARRSTTSRTPASPARATRLAIVGALFILALGALVARLMAVQVVDHDRLAGMAAKSQYRRIHLEPPRGRVVDRHGTLLAFSTDNISLSARRERVADPDAVADSLATLGVSRRGTLQKLEPDSGYVWLTRTLLPEGRARSLAASLEGVQAERERKRITPQGPLAREIVGRWSEDPDLLCGIERRFDERLRGESGWEWTVLDAVGNRYVTTTRCDPVAGWDVVLTLDARIQEIAELALADAVAEHGARGGVIVVVDPHDGDILAMASLGRAGERSFSNRAVTEPIEIGSCAKVVTAVAALEYGVADTSRAFYCGILPDEENPPTVEDDHGEAEYLSFRRIIVESRNIGTARIARLLGAERLHAMLDVYGFGSRTGIELPGESAGLVRRVEDWSGVSVDAVSIGYEFSATPLQWSMAYAAVANGGRLLRPRIVRELVAPDGSRRTESGPEVVREVMSEETARTLRHVFRDVTKAGGTGRSADVPWLDVAGKTGTARKWDAEAGTYSHRRHIASFVGFAPWDEPRYVCAVVIDEPAGAHYYGGDVSAPVFRRVIEQIAAVYPETLRGDAEHLRVRVVPDEPAIGSNDALAAPGHASEPHGVPDLRGMAVAPAERLARRRGYEVEREGAGDRVLDQRPLPGEDPAASILLVTDTLAESVRVPDLTGLSFRRALATLSAVGLSATRQGVGTVRAQRPPAGTDTARGAVVALTLDPENWGRR